MPELSPISVAFLVFPNVTQLDLTGPAQVLSRLGNVTLNLVWKELSLVCWTETDSQFRKVMAPGVITSDLSFLRCVVYKIYGNLGGK